MMRKGKPEGLSAEAGRAYDVMLSGGVLAATARAVRELPADHRAFAGRRAIRQAPVHLITADRPSRARIRRAHEALAEQLGGTCEVWPDTGHTLHLQYPDRVVEATLDIIHRATG